MHKLLMGVAAGVTAAFLSTAPAQAAEPLIDAKSFPGEFSANVSLVSEYYFRGVSQTDDAPAAQGGFDWSATVDEGTGIGVYLGVWGSNVDFNEAAGVDGATIEIDWYAGLTGPVGETGVSWDVGVIYYSYPGADRNLNYDFFEGQIALSYDFGLAAATASLNYSPDNFGGTGDAFYPKLGIEAPIGKYLTLSAHVAKQYVDDNANFGLPDYVEYGIGATVNLAGFDVNLTWSDTDMSETECGDACGMLLLSVSRSF
ncbi:MAG: TorF family putative porin [Alphaproteobacteria bacterium]